MLKFQNGAHYDCAIPAHSSRSFEMNHQTRRQSLLEAATQAAVGVPIGFSVVFFVGFLDLNPFWLALSTSCVMFLVSSIRGYVIRRRFERFARSIQTLGYDKRIKDIIEGSTE